MRTPKSIFWLAVVGLLISASNMALAQTARDFLDNYVDPLKMQDTPVFYAECSYKGTKVMVIFPLGASKGRVVELAWGNGGGKANPALANEGEFTVTSKVNLDDLMVGGPGAYRFQTQIIEYLLGTPFTMVYPRALYSIVGSRPKTTCHPSP
jgi:hypothetical protein